MTNLEVSVDADFDAVRNVRVPASIWAVPPSNASIRDVTLPVGREAPPAQFVVSNGRYLVDALLPSGQHVTAHIEVTEDRTTNVLLPSGDDEWRYLEDTAPAPPSDDLISTSARVVRQLPDVAIAVAGAVGRRLRRSSSAPSDDSDNITVTIARPRSGTTGCAYEPTLSALDADPLIEGVAELLELSRVDHRVLRYGRTSLTLDTAKTDHGTVLVCEHDEHLEVKILPTPWNRADATGVQVQVKRADNGFRVTVHTPDAGLDTALRFMGQTRIEAATTLLRERLLNTDTHFDAPYAFLYGCYQLIGALSDDFDKVAQMIDLFCRVHPSITDGLIVRATYALRRNDARDADVAVTARTALLQAYDMGLPTFRQGLTWLADGLTRFDDDMCARAAHNVRTVAWSAGNDALFTSVRLNR